MEYKTPAEARNLPGLRLVLSAGSPAPWGECAKNVFYVKKIPYIPVAQQVAADNEDLVAWTGIRNAPVAVYNNERARDRWLDILMLAERLSPENPLLPENAEERVQVIGLANEICGEWGFGWCRRIEMVGPPPEPSADNPQQARIRREYGVSLATYEAAPKRTAQILQNLSRILKAQRAAGSRYFVGKGLTAVDLYWAAFATILKPMPADVCPAPDYFRKLYETALPETHAAADPILFEHRDYIYKTHLKLPFDF
jgi:glutathione S-transferase